MLLPLSIPSPNWNGFSIGPFSIRAYALCILLGIVLALWMTAIRLKRRGVDPGIVIDVAFWAVPLGVIFARAYHVLTHPTDYFFAGADPWAVVRIWDGGIAIFGAMIGGLLGIWIGTRIAGIRFSAFLDAVAPAMLLAQAVGRLGNWFNHELFGVPTDLPWGLEIPVDNPVFPHGLPATTLFHPLFLYEAIWNVVGCLVLIWASRKFSLQWGRTLALYAVWYGVGRYFLEGLRIDPTELVLGIQINQLVAGVFAVFGVVLFIFLTRRHPGLEPSPYLPGREPVVSPADQADSGESAQDAQDESELSKSHVESEVKSVEVPVAPATSTLGEADKA